MGMPSRSLIAVLGTLLIAACADELPLEPDAKHVPPKSVSPALPGVETAAAPANDDFGSATAVSALPFSDNISTVDATTAGDDPQDCAGTGPTVWYSYTAAQTIHLSAHTLGSDYDTGLSVYTGTLGSLSQIACNDDAGGLHSHVRFTAVAGETYYFMVGAFASGPGGNLVFTLEEGLPPLEVGLGLDRFGSVNAGSGTATVRGTVTCSRPTFVDIFGQLRQRAGRVLVTADLFVSLQCDGVTAWETQAIAAGGLFAGGQAEVTLGASFADPATGEDASDEASGTVRLRGQGKSR